MLSDSFVCLFNVIGAQSGKKGATVPVLMAPLTITENAK
jgi:hypothetical protein